MSTTLGAVECDTCQGTLTINGISMHQAPAWCCWDLAPLMFGPDLKGMPYVEQPDAHGAWGYPQYDGATTVPLPIIISGFYAANGTRYSDEWDGFWTNLKYLRDNLFDMRDGSGDPVTSWAATYTLPDATVLTADVKLSKLTPGKSLKALYACSFQMTILDGVFR